MAQSYPARMRRLPPRALVVCLLSACSTEFASDYTLNLIPHTLTGQDPFVDGRSVELVILASDGESTTHFAGEIAGNELVVEDLPPVEAGATVGLLVEDVGGEPGVADLDLVAAWGSAVVEAPLATGEQTVDLDVLVAEIGAIGDMGVLADSRRAQGAAVAMLPTGDVYLFGGSAVGESSSEPPSDRIQWLTALDSGTWTFDRIDEKIPTRDGVAGTRYGMAASVVDVDGELLVFVTGGRVESGIIPGTPSSAGFLFDPVAQTIVWGDKDTHASMTIARSEHGHVVLDNQKVVVFGGHTSVVGASLEVFTPKSRRFDWVGSGLTHGDRYPAGASLGVGGALICGGGAASLDNTVPVDGCDQITLGGVVTSADAMIQPVFGHAMARLADGRVLATGGVVQTVPDQDRANATSDAWIYENDRWSRLPSTMKNPRAHHAIVPLPDGNALILGGTETGGGVFPVPTPAVVCAEIFDAKAGTFRELDPCTNVGAGANPGWSKVDTDGAFVLAGFDGANATPAGDAFGFIAFTPAL